LRRLTAKYFVIATGSVVSPPPLPALEEVGYITSDRALSLKKLPKSLIILGGGATACELAQFFARFDVKVTQIQRSAHVLKEFDEDARGGRNGVSSRRHQVVHRHETVGCAAQWSARSWV
jgi:pyruvate/2-oxoglutarate dehydrogenase complex dihydrolipoamide dehydrogenase (E3) component